MKIVIAGSSGVLGRRLIEQFRARGHNVTGLVRNQRGEQIVQALGAESRQVDLFDVDALARAAEGAEVVIHAATAIPTGARSKPGDWQMNDRIRREGTNALVDSAAKVGAKLYIQQSIVWVARPANGIPFDEDSPPNTTGQYSSAYDGEVIAREAGERRGFAVQVLRCGWFYSSDSAQTRSMAERVAKRILPIPGKGDAIWAMLHAGDAAGAFVTAAEGGQSGLWHIVDDQPVTVSSYLNYLADRLKAPRPLHVPLWLFRLVFNRGGTGQYTTSTRTTNTRFRRDFGWSPKYANFIEGLDQVAADWQQEGFLPHKQR